MPIQPAQTTLQNELFQKRVLDEITLWLTNYTSERTKQAYARVLQSFSAFIAGNPLEATTQDVIDYRDYLTAELKRSNSTINQHLYAIRAFYGHLVKSGLLTENVATPVKATKVIPYGKTKALNTKEDEHIILLESIDTDEEMGARDYAIVLLLITTGLRVSAISNAVVSDIVKSGSRYYLQFINKGGNEDSAQLTPDVIQALKHYFSLRVISGNSPLFRTVRGKSGNSSQTFGKAMSRVAISKMITKRAKQAGVSNISAHSLRHTSAIILKKKGFSVSAIQKHLRHSDQRTTLIYLDHLDDDTDDEIASAMSDLKI